MMKEKQTNGLPGLPLLLLLIAGGACAGYQFVTHIKGGDLLAGGLWLLGAVLTMVLLGGLFVVNPNEAKVLQLFGAYKGTAKNAGLR